MISRMAVSALAALCVGVSGAVTSKIPIYITAAVADPNRPEADTKRDAGRKPAGFVLESESQVLRNPADDHTKRVFDSSIRGSTDQFILKFRKPGRRATR